MRAWTSDDTWHLHGGTHARLYEVLGAFPTERGVCFRAWAPDCDAVRVVGDWCGYDSDGDALERIAGTAVFEGEVAAAAVGHTYKLRLRGPDGRWHERADPFAAWAEVPPRTASRVARTDHVWGDAAWLSRRQQSDPWREPVSIYEVHLGSWADPATLDPALPPYRAIAPRLAEHCLRLGFTHVELMPVMEHPFDGSWGYQVTGFFAPTSRFGTPDDLRWLIDHLHARGLGVLLDWVPAHFPTDAHALYRYTGQAVFEHPDPRRGFHPDWTTAIFDYGRPEVASFLLSSATCWLDRFHVDGLRVDAVASMLYLDYSRADGAWLPNADGGNENHDAVALLERVTTTVGASWPKALLIAEESTAWPGVTRPVDQGGLGFGFKWDMGWMNDTLRYLARDPIHRPHHHDEITFRGLYAHSERFVLPLSHDEVVHGKGSLLARMPGDPWQRLANVRLLLGLMYGQTGKKLLFMGTELAPEHEWRHDAPLPWSALDDPGHRGVFELVGALNRLLADEGALHRGDAEPDGAAWVVADDRAQAVFAWLRHGADAPDVLVVANATPVPRPAYRLGVPAVGDWRIVLDTDATRFGGSGYGRDVTVPADPIPAHGRHASVSLDLPPLAVLFVRAPRSA